MFPDIILVVLLGLVFGSFASAVAWRVPRGVSWVTARSACPACKTLLGFPDLIPIFSWLALRGRCRHCGHAIGIYYPLLELLTLCLCVISYFVFGLTTQSLVVMAAMPFLVALIAIDFEHFILPDQLNIILGVLGLVFVMTSMDVGLIVLNLMAAALFAGVSFVLGWSMRKVMKKDVLGLGDVKFFAVAGLWLGLGMLPHFMILSGLAGVGIGCFWKFKRGSEAFPFGPALIFAFLICLGFGAEIQGFSGSFY